MNIEQFAIRSVVGALCAGAGLAVAAMPPPLKDRPAFDRTVMMAETQAYNKKDDQPGTGKFPALKEVDPTLADHVVYRPADLGKLGNLKLGVLAWGNGGCGNDGAGGRFHLAEIASHGYLVIANGKILTGPGAPPRPPRPEGPPAAPAAGAGPAAAPGAAPGAPPAAPRPPATKASDLTAAIDWALAENARKDSKYYGRIDPKQIAVSGWSCGGIQALTIATSDPRVAAIVVHNSGIFDRAPDANSGSASMNLDKSALKKLRTPVIYILGGQTDIAYSNGLDDFSRIEHVPVMVASIHRDHGGTFMDDNGGAAASVAVSWLNWQLRGDKEAAKRFVGKDCGLCKDAKWDVDRKKLDTMK